MQRISYFRVFNKRLLIRCDFNVPLDQRGSIVDDFRIRESLPTIQYAIKKKARVILIAHLGRPTSIYKRIQNSRLRPAERDCGGQAKLKIRETAFPKEYSLQPVAKRLERLLKMEIMFVQERIGPRVKQRLEQLEAGQAALLENIRLYAGEEANDRWFAKELAALGDIFINEAFSASHRAHASIVGIARHLPSGAGFLLAKEVNALKKIAANPKRPLVAIVGGSKIETKTKFLDKLSRDADTVLVGSLVYQEITRKKLALKDSPILKGPVDGVPNRKTPFDIGPKTISIFEQDIKNAKTIFWTGPLGKIEEKRYTKGSLAIARAIVQSPAYSIAGGGDLNRFLFEHGFRDKFTHISTGGGAMLAFLAGEKLPGLEALER